MHIFFRHFTCEKKDRKSTFLISLENIHFSNPFFLSNSRVIVGAPEDESEQAKVGIEKAGAVYRCQTQMPFRCDQIPFDTSGKNFSVTSN